MHFQNQSTLLLESSNKSGQSTAVFQKCDKIASSAIRWGCEEKAIKPGTLIQRKPRADAPWNTCFAASPEEDINANPKFAWNTSFGASAVGPEFGGRKWEKENVDILKQLLDKISLSALQLKTRLWRVLATRPVLGIFFTTRTLLGKSITRPSSE